MHPVIKQKVITIFRTIASQFSIELGEISCLSDHIHISLSAPPRLAPARVAQILKSKSTRMLFKELAFLKNEYWGGEIWAGGYFVRSVGKGLTKEQIDKYVREQAEEIS
jgi:putative transposase